MFTTGWLPALVKNLLLLTVAYLLFFVLGTIKFYIKEWTSAEVNNWLEQEGCAEEGAMFEGLLIF